MIYVVNIHKQFAKLEALKQVSLSLESGKVYALIGPNGSGKTTLIKCILGLVIPSGGDILLHSKTISNQFAYRQEIGYMPQVGRYPENLTIGQLFVMMKDIRKSDTPLDESLYYGFGLDKLQHKRMHTLSGGTRQKVSAALAFLFNPPVLILDEPTAGLDPVASEYLKEKIFEEKKAGKLIIITSHIMSDLDEMATDLIYMYEGSVLYNNAITTLKSETGEKKLGKAITRLLQNESLFA